MIRPSDKGPGKARPPRTKASGGRSSTPPSSGEKKTGCWSVALPAAIPALTLLAACVAYRS